MLVVGIIASAISASNALQKTAGHIAILDSVRRWDRLVTLPAMLLVWALGLTLAVQGVWFNAPWLMIKLAFVLLLSIMHGVLSGTLRRLAHARQSPLTTTIRYTPAAIVVCVLVVVSLVVIKPV